MFTLKREAAETARGQQQTSTSTGVVLNDEVKLIAFIKSKSSIWANQRNFAKEPAEDLGTSGPLPAAVKM